MFLKSALCLSVAWVLVAGSPEIPRDSWLHHSGTSKTQWNDRPREDFHESRGISHGYSSHAYESTLKATETSSEHPGYSSSSQEYWRPGSVNWNSTGVGYYGYSRTQPGSANVGGSSGLSYQQSSHSSWPYRHQYRHQQVRPGHFAFKKTPVKGSAQSYDVSGKLKYKKTSSPQSSSRHPVLYDPYIKYKHPVRKTVHPHHGKYRQSLYQRYAIPYQRYKVEEASTASPMQTSVGYLTTERMDDAQPEGSSPSEDYYGDARQKSDGSYYEAYEETDKSTTGSEGSQYDESTTRGYYGDRIYMSAQVPVVSSDKTAVKNKYYIVRRTTGDDIETIFE